MQNVFIVGISATNTDFLVDYYYDVDVENSGIDCSSLSGFGSLSSFYFEDTYNSAEWKKSSYSFEYMPVDYPETIINKFECVYIL